MIKILTIIMDMLFIVAAVALLTSKQYEAGFLCMIFMELKGINIALRATQEQKQ